MRREDSIHPAARGVVGLMLAALTGIIVWATTTLPAEFVGMAQAVRAHLEEAGADNPVTAVLLNYRAYDTLLEIVVLTLALAAIWSLQRASAQPLAARAGRVLTKVVAMLIPLIILVGGYLLGAGASAPGGAFQAGAVIASAGILLLLADYPVMPSRRGLLRSGVALGGLVFVGVGFACLLAGLEFLEYPAGWAKTLIIVVEAASTISIALILAGVFAGSSRVMVEGYKAEAIDEEEM